ncbi:hypothetical protein CEX98_19075 [Pseudoalteromonas piscicida]|uniref:Uncharacterized protein n=1 Tax=Pseudoalteromonas piscicida TaxID=43662 RepID=A0A2A5JLE9_PSEO7|nr:hypothetical protein CEX98_19075 [Pseudoalteromonas piscicida]
MQCSQATLIVVWLFYLFTTPPPKAVGICFTQRVARAQEQVSATQPKVYYPFICINVPVISAEKWFFYALTVFL